MSNMMKLMLLTTDVNFAIEAQSVGVDRIFVDLEYIGKAERQRGRNTLLSNNSIEDVLKIKTIIKTSELLVRVNPLHPGSIDEINKVIDAGADIVMLPMIMDAEDVKYFIKIVNGRVRTCLLLETSQALARFDEIIEVNGVDEIYIGLNDMHISMGLSFMFEILAGGLVDYMAAKCKVKGLPFGFGGIAKIGEGALPADLILGEHYRIGSNCVILSRTFRNEVGSKIDQTIVLEDEINKIRKRELEIKSWQTIDYVKNQNNVIQITRNIVKKIVEKL